MKNLVKAFCLIFAITLFTNLFTSCKKDTTLPTPDKKETPKETPTENPSSGMSASQVSQMMSFAGVNDFVLDDSIDLCDCFDLFDEVDWEASPNVIIAQLEVIFDGLSEEEADALFTPVCTADGDFYLNACIATCNNITDFQECDFDGETEIEWEDCFEFVYPLTVVLPNAPNQTVNTNEELITVVDAWYDANDNSNEDVSLDYPVQIIMSDGTNGTVNSDDELEDLFDDCDDHQMEECFTFNFPLTLLFPDSTTQDINSIDEGEAAVEAWEDANPNGDDVTIVFPIQVTLEDGTIQTINNEDELDVLFDECDFDFCFTGEDSNKLTNRRPEETK